MVRITGLNCWPDCDKQVCCQLSHPACVYLVKYLINLTLSIFMYIWCRTIKCHGSWKLVKFVTCYQGCCCCCCFCIICTLSFQYYYCCQWDSTLNPLQLMNTVSMGSYHITHLSSALSVQFAFGFYIPLLLRARCSLIAMMKFKLGIY